jgi:hypothetical protein
MLPHLLGSNIWEINISVPSQRRRPLRKKRKLFSFHRILRCHNQVNSWSSPGAHVVDQEGGKASQECVYLTTDLPQDRWLSLVKTSNRDRSNR